MKTEAKISTMTSTVLYVLPKRSGISVLDKVSRNGTAKGRLKNNLIQVLNIIMGLIKIEIVKSTAG